MIRVSYDNNTKVDSGDNGNHAESLNDWMQREIFLKSSPVNTKVRITQEPNYIRVNPI